jgi:lysophospholipase L1-like esterase
MALIRKLRRALIWLAAGVLTLAFAGQTTGLNGANADQPAGATRAMNILVLGDSYSAGNGADDYYGTAGCWRSHKNYAEQFAAQLSPRGVVRTVACSGDTTAEFTDSKDGRSPQLDAVTGSEDLIFVTVGSSDIHLEDIVTNCLVRHSRNGTACEESLTRAKKILDDEGLKSKIAGVIESIHRKADRATIVLLGYPPLEGDSNYKLRSRQEGNHVVNVGESTRQISKQLEGIYKSIVAGSDSKKLKYVSVLDLFDGHELSAKKTNPLRWMVQPGKDASAAYRDTYYHPNLMGWTQEANLLYFNPLVPKVVPVSGANTLDLRSIFATRSGSKVIWKLHIVASPVDPLKGITVRYLCRDPKSDDPNSYTYTSPPRGTADFKTVREKDGDGYYEVSADVSGIPPSHCSTYYVELTSRDQNVFFGTPSPDDGGDKEFPFAEFDIPK